MAKVMRVPESKFPFTCDDCGEEFDKGEPVWWEPATGVLGTTTMCDACGTAEYQPPQKARLR